MAAREDLWTANNRLLAALAKAERRLHAGQPVTSADLYAEAAAAVEQVTARVLAAVEAADRTALSGTAGRGHA